MAKIKRIIRPEIEVEYVGVEGFFASICAIVKVGIKTFVLNVTAKGNRGNEFVLQKIRCFCIPKYRLKRVDKLSEDAEE